MTKSNGWASALDAETTTGEDERTAQQRADEEREQAEQTVARLQIKRDKAQQQLADAEQALADAEAELKGEH